MLTIDRASGLPIYLQIRHQINHVRLGFGAETPKVQAGLAQLEVFAREASRREPALSR